MTKHKDAMTPGQVADIAAIVQQARGDLCWIPDCTALDALRKCVDISEAFAAQAAELTALRAERDVALVRVGVLEAALEKLYDLMCEGFEGDGNSGCGQCTDKCTGCIAFAALANKGAAE